MGWVCVVCAAPCRARDGHEMMTEAFFAVPPSLQVATEEGSFSLLRKKKKQIGGGGWGGGGPRFREAGHTTNTGLVGPGWSVGARPRAK
jgi:hypothetical protein